MSLIWVSFSFCGFKILPYCGSSIVSFIVLNCCHHARFVSRLFLANALSLLYAHLFDLFHFHLAFCLPFLTLVVSILPNIQMHVFPLGLPEFWNVLLAVMLQITYKVLLLQWFCLFFCILRFVQKFFIQILEYHFQTLRV